LTDSNCSTKWMRMKREILVFAAGCILVKTAPDDLALSGLESKDDTRIRIKLNPSKSLRDGVRPKKYTNLCKRDMP
jgi:hypothetical protein